MLAQNIKDKNLEVFYVANVRCICRNTGYVPQKNTDVFSFIDRLVQRSRWQRLKTFLRATSRR